MSSLPVETLFSVPLSHLADPRVSGDQVAHAAPLTGLKRFIADGENLSLRFLADGFPWPSACWPLILHGPTGTGKTTLGMAVLHQHFTEVAAATGAAPEFLPASDLVRRYRAAVETDSVSEWRKRWRSGLMVDNLQYLDGHAGAQRELLILVDYLVDTGRPLIFTMNSSPGEATWLLPPLRSRLTSGLSLAIDPPGLAARRALLSELSSVQDLSLEQEAIDWLAEKIALTVPGMNHLLAQFKLSHGNPANGPPVTRADLESWLTKVRRGAADEKIRSVLRAVAQAGGFRIRDLTGSSRKQSLTLFRGMAMYLCRELLDVSYGLIGKRFGRRDHSTVMHACRKIRDLVEAEPDGVTARQIRQLRSELYGQFNLDMGDPGENLSGKC